MIRFSLYSMETGVREGKWHFHENGDGMDVLDAKGVRVCWFPFEAADDRFLLPSFWRSIKNIGVKLDDGSTVWFEKDRRTVARVKDFLDEAVVSRGPAAVQALWKKAWMYSFLGLGALISGCLAFAVLKGVFAIERRGAYYGVAALVLYGIGQAAWGISNLFRAARLRRWLREEEESP
jgi:hypothetical protein